MLADVVTTAASWSNDHSRLTYLVPPAMEAEAQPGQLVAVPYGERLAEGILWSIHHQDNASEFDHDVELRPLHTIIDPEPALLPHQMALAEWMAEYYVTPLAQIAMMMLPPGLMQRSQVVLHLVKSEQGETGEFQQPEAVSLRLQALIGLLLTEGELDIEQLKQMLGPKRAREVLKEAS